MGESAQFVIGSTVRCTDGVCGTLAQVVVDPVARSLTHLVVDRQRRWPGTGRLVPIDLVDSSADEIRLRCTLSEFKQLEPSEERHFLLGAGGDLGYHEQVLSWPHFGLGGLGMRGGGSAMEMGVEDRGLNVGGDVRVADGPHLMTTYDRVPVGEVEVRRGDRVHARDGEIGRVRGLVIDPRDHGVTHVLLDDGHVWGKAQVAIPITAVEAVDQGVHVKLTKGEIRDLPHVDLDHPG
jgi:hypothetical protein